MNNKFYKVIKDTFLWEEGAVLTNSASNGNGYMPIDDIFIKECAENVGEYISDDIIENNPEWFQRVYPVNLLSKTVYKIKEEAKELLAKGYKE